MPKLSERIPELLGWSSWFKEATWTRELAEELEAHGERLDILEGKHKEQAPVDRRLVEEALGMALRGQFARHAALGPATRFEQIIDVLCRALEGDPDDQED